MPLSAQAAVSQALGRDARSYHASVTVDGYRIENAGHGLTARFSTEGVGVRTEAGRLQLALESYGFGESLRQVGTPALRSDANAVTLRYGQIDECYINGPAGLEQGFTIEKRPQGNAVGPLTLSLSFGGELTPRLEPGGDGLTFDGSTLRYSGLVVNDARGTEVPAHIELHGHNVLIRVDDQRAHYPLTIDPWLQDQMLRGSDIGLADRMGDDIAVSGDTLVVGASRQPVLTTQKGAAYVFVKGSSGVWSQAAKLTASDGAQLDAFGQSVAIDNETIVVGAPRDDVGTNQDQGSAYVFLKPPSGWKNTTEAAKLTSVDGAAGDLFATSVAVSADTVAVGSQVTIGTNQSQGAVYVFTKASGGWPSTTQTAKLTASDGKQPDNLGFRLAMWGDTIVAGAPFDSSSSFTFHGSAYVFERPAGGWVNGTEKAKLTASDGEGDLMGLAVAIQDDTIVVGSPLDDDDCEDQGSAYVYVRPSGGWATGTETAKLTSSDGCVRDNLGGSVAIDGDKIVLGAPAAENFRGALHAGVAYLYVKGAGGWASMDESQKLQANDGLNDEFFGIDVDVEGDTIFVSANMDGVEFFGQSFGQFGSVYTFLLKHRLEVTLEDAGGTGTVSSVGPGIDCGLVCGEFFRDAGTMTLEAKADPQSSFQGWSGDCFGIGDCVVTMSGARNVTATFGPQDKVAPTLTLESNVPDPTNASPIPVTAQFSEAVIDFELGDVTATNATVDNFAVVDGDTFTFDLTPTGQGLVTADVGQNAAKDASSNHSEAATQFSRTFDNIAPTVTLSSTAPDPTTDSPIPVTAQFSEPVTGFDAADIVTTLATVDNFVAVDSDTFTFELTPTDFGSVTAEIGGGSALDAAGNGNSPATHLTRTFEALSADLCARSTAATIKGTAGDDVLTGTPGDDIICAFGGADVVNGEGGNDIVFGGRGKDSLVGGTGRDTLYGGTKNDLIQGGMGRDFLLGNRGKDSLRGGGRLDLLKGGPGNDSLSGGKGNDTLKGGSAFDSCSGGPGKDVLGGCERSPTSNRQMTSKKLAGLTRRRA